MNGNSTSKMIKRNAVIILILSLLAITFAGNADAQFWKKKKKKHTQQQSTAPRSDTAAAQKPLTKQQKKEKKRKEKEERKKAKREQKQKEKDAKKKGATNKKPPVKPVVPLVKKRAELVYPATIMKPRYRIDILAELYLDELVKGKYVTYKDKIPDKALPGTAFIEGVNIAADSLKKAGFSVDIYIHDASSFSESPEMLVRGKLDSSDLIIGAVQPQDISVLAAFARKKHIYFVSALSPADGNIRDNQFFTLIEPTLKGHCEWMMHDLAKKHAGQNVTLLYRTANITDEHAYAAISDDTESKVFFKPLLCNILPNKQSLGAVIDSSKTNVVIIPVTDIVYADSLLRVLSHNFPNTHFEIYGMPSWTEIADIHKAKVFPNLHISITTPFNFNPASPSGIYVERAFKKDYAGKTSEMVYRGYETIFWYTHLLKQYGTVFKYTDNASTPFTPFEISPQWDRNNDLLYNENKHLYLTTYENGVGKTE